MLSEEGVTCPTSIPCEEICCLSSLILIFFSNLYSSNAPPVKSIPRRSPEVNKKYSPGKMISIEKTKYQTLNFIKLFIYFLPPLDLSLVLPLNHRRFFLSYFQYFSPFFFKNSRFF